MDRCSRWFLIFEEAREKSVMNRSRPYASYHPSHHHHHHARKERKQIMWTRSWLMQYRWSSAFLTPALESLEISALTLSICTSCVNTKMVGVKNLPRKKKRWALIWHGHYPLYNARSRWRYVHFSHQLHAAASRRERGYFVAMASKRAESNSL